MLGLFHRYFTYWRRNSSIWGKTADKCCNQAITLIENGHRSIRLFPARSPLMRSWTFQLRACRFPPDDGLTARPPEDKRTCEAERGTEPTHANSERDLGWTCGIR